MIRFASFFCAIFAIIGCTPRLPSQSVNIVTLIPTDNSTPVEVPTVEVVPEIPTCDAETVNLAEYQPSTSTWIQSSGGQLMQGDQPFEVIGVNFYPRLAPFEHFLVDTKLDVLQQELDVITPSGINTLRIFIDLSQLFACDIQAIPVLERFDLLDGIIQTIASNNLHVIVVLHQNISDLSQSNWDQVQFIAHRYHHEPAILAWDVLDKGDHFYIEGLSDDVLVWLANGILAIREADANHLITAGWETHAVDTIPLVDIVSFQHFGDYQPLRQEIANLKSRTTKPILLTAIGYSTYELDETAQRNLLYQAFEESRNNQLAGWLVYMAFDYPTSVTCVEPDCPAPPQAINFYGIWNTSYFPKLAVDAVKRTTQSD